MRRSPSIALSVLALSVAACCPSPEQDAMVALLGNPSVVAAPGANQIFGDNSKRFVFDDGLAIDAQGRAYGVDGNALYRTSPSDTAYLAGTRDRDRGAGFCNGDVLLDHDGNLLVTDTCNDRVWRISPDGHITGVGQGAFEGPDGLTMAADGSLYVANAASATITRVAPDGTTSRFDDGTHHGVKKLAADASGNVWLTSYHGVYKFSPQGKGQLIAGGNEKGYADGPGATARFDDPNFLVVDAQGTVYLTETKANRLRKIAPDGTVSTFANTIAWTSPRGIGLDTDGTLLVVDEHGLTRLAPDGTARPSGFPTTNDYYGTSGLALDARGIVLLQGGAYGSPRLMRLSRSGAASYAAMLLPTDFADGPAAAARFHAPHGVALAPDGSLYVADTGNARVRKLSPDGQVTTVLGDWKPTSSGAIEGEKLVEPTDVAFDATGALYVADYGGGRIVKVAPDGKTSTFSESLKQPSRLVARPDGGLYVIDGAEPRIPVPASPMPTPSQVMALGPDGLPRPLPSGVTFKDPSDVLVDGRGRLVVAEYSDRYAYYFQLLVRRLEADGHLTTLIDGQSPRAVTGQRFQVQCQPPWQAPARANRLAIAPDGALYIGIPYNAQLLKLSGLD